MSQDAIWQGKGWVNLTAALQSYRTRTDLVRLGYTREIEPGNWRGDIAYIGRYRPTGMGAYHRPQHRARVR